MKQEGNKKPIKKLYTGGLLEICRAASILICGTTLMTTLHTGMDISKYHIKSFDAETNASFV
jgi:hypothetical protein